MPNMALRYVELEAGLHGAITQTLGCMSGSVELPDVCPTDAGNVNESRSMLPQLLHL